MYCNPTHLFVLQFIYTTTAVSIGSRTLSNYTYSSDRNHYLTRLDYGNGDYTAYTRDEKGRILVETYEDGETVSYTYDQSGSLVKTEDSESETTTTMNYDYIGRVNNYRKVNEAIDMSFTYEYNEDNLLTSVRDVYNNHARGISYSYDEDERVTEFSHARGYRFYTYDAFNRLSTYTTKFKRASDETLVTAITTTFNYETLADGTVTGLVDSVRQQGSNFDDTFTYTYEANGNILSVSDGTYTTSYVYDSANQLLRENNQKAGFTYTWEYDNAGNILTRKEYSYTTGSLETITPSDTINYTYGDQTWGDLLTAYDGQAITYDEIGNPLTDGTWTYTWAHGRELSSLSKTGTTWDFTYDENGYRTKRTNGTKTYDYAYVDGLLRYMEIDGIPYYFTYAPDGTPMGIVENDTPYFYELNLQGDIVGITSYTGYRVVQYTYDAWGNILSCTGSRANTIGKRNPLRYRGYAYDEETGFYYLISRYYSAETGRFLNADEYIIFISGNNLFSYCFNNAINKIDEFGCFPVCFQIDKIISYPPKREDADNKRPYIGEPGSTYIAPNGDSRTYGSDGKPERDYDHSDHGNPNKHPHDQNGGHIHDWENGIRGKAHLIETKSIFGSIIILVGVASLLVLAVDDASGIGTIDDVLFAPICVGIEKSIQLLN